MIKRDEAAGGNAGGLAYFDRDQSARRYIPSNDASPPPAGAKGSE
jgi:hypothetical protein